MAKVQYVVPFPDGTSQTKIAPDYVEHSLAVIALMRLRRVLPPLNPDDKDEEPRYHRFQAWQLVATTDTPKRADYLSTHLVYAASTLETHIVPIVAEPYTPSPEKVAAGQRLRHALLGAQAGGSLPPVAEKEDDEEAALASLDVEDL